MKTPISMDELKKIIEDEVNPVLALHSGSCEVKKYDPESRVVSIRLHGGCVGCPSSTLTLYNGIVPILQDHYPELEVELM